MIGPVRKQILVLTETGKNKLQNLYKFKLSLKKN